MPNILSATEIQLNQWLDMIQENLDSISEEVMSRSDIGEVDILKVREYLSKQYSLLTVIGDVATGRKKLVGTRRFK